MAKFFLFIIPNQNFTAKYLKITTIASEWQRVQIHNKNEAYCYQISSLSKTCCRQNNFHFPIDTKDQLADIFTNPLDRVIFRKLRLLLMGW